VSGEPGEPGRPPPQPSSQALAGALAANAATKPFNILAALAGFAVPFAVGAPVIVALLVAMVVYAAAAARTMFDAAETERVTAAAGANDDAERRP
jgi:hypothetical protein